MTVIVIKRYFYLHHPWFCRPYSAVETEAQIQAVALNPE